MVLCPGCIEPGLFLLSFLYVQLVAACFQLGELRDLPLTFVSLLKQNPETDIGVQPEDQKSKAVTGSYLNLKLQ